MSKNYYSDRINIKNHAIVYNNTGTYDLNFYPNTNYYTEFIINDGGTLRTAISINNNTSDISFPRRGGGHVGANLGTADGGQRIPTGTVTRVEFDPNTPRFNILSELGSDTLPNTVYKCKAAGIYLCSAVITWQTLFSTSNYVLYLRKGSTNMANTQMHHVNAHNKYSQVLSCAINCAVNDELSFWVFHDGLTSMGLEDNYCSVSYAKIA